jgi:ABC-type glycerol-3-phosphate transport system substrate-binding protein
MVMRRNTFVKHKKLLRLSAVLIALAVLFVVAGCNPATATQNSSTQNTTKQGTTASGTTTQKPAEVVTLSMFFSSPEMYPGWKFGDDPITKAFIEEVGVSVDIKYASNSDNQELYTMLSSGQKLPDLLKAKFDPMFIDEEFVLPLNKLADEHYPEFYELLHYQYADVHSLSDGNIYYMNSMYADIRSLGELSGGKKGVSSMAVNTT